MPRPLPAWKVSVCMPLVLEKYPRCGVWRAWSVGRVLFCVAAKRSYQLLTTRGAPYSATRKRTPCWPATWRLCRRICTENNCRLGCICTSSFIHTCEFVCLCTLPRAVVARKTLENSHQHQTNTSSKSLISKSMSSSSKYPPPPPSPLPPPLLLSRIDVSALPLLTSPFGRASSLSPGLVVPLCRRPLVRSPAAPPSRDSVLPCLSSPSLDLASLLRRCSLAASGWLVVDVLELVAASSPGISFPVGRGFPDPPSRSRAFLSASIILKSHAGMRERHRLPGKLRLQLREAPIIGFGRPRLFFFCRILSLEQIPLSQPTNQRRASRFRRC